MVLQSQLRRKTKEAMRKAHVGARGKMREKAEKEKGKVGGSGGSASAIVINGEKLVMANMGGYRAVVCRDGEAHQINRTRQNQGTKKHWSRKLIPGSIFYFIKSHQFGTCTSLSVLMAALFLHIRPISTRESYRNRSFWWTLE